MAIIVFMNEQDKTVTIIDGQDVSVIDWGDVNAIGDIVAGQEVYYVTSAEFVDGGSIVELLSEITGNDYDPSVKHSNAKYLRSIGASKLLCRGSDGKDVTFSGPTDIKSIADLPKGTMENNHNLLKCIELGKVQIIDEASRKKVLDEASKKKKSKNARDAAIDSILIKTSVDEFLKNDGKSPDDIPEIEISASASFKKEDNEEVYGNLKKLGLNPEG